MTLIQKLVTEHAKSHGPGCKFVKNFALCKSIWELNRLSKKNPHVSLMKKMLQEMPEKEWPTPQVKGFVEGSIKKSEMPNTQIFLLNDLLMQFFTCYKTALSACRNFIGDPDLELSNDEFTKIMVTSFAIRNRQPQTQAKLQRKQESEIMRHELLKKFKSDFDFPAPHLNNIASTQQHLQNIAQQNSNLLASTQNHLNKLQNLQTQASVAQNNITIQQLQQIQHAQQQHQQQQQAQHQAQQLQQQIASSQAQQISQENNLPNSSANLTALINKNGFINDGPKIGKHPAVEVLMQMQKQQNGTLRLETKNF